MPQQMYCVRCKRKNNCSSVKVEKDKNGKNRLVGKCTNCGLKCFQYISSNNPMLKSVSRKTKSKGKSKSKGKNKSKAKNIFNYKTLYM